METLVGTHTIFPLVIADGFLVGSEFAILSVRGMRVAAMAEAGFLLARAGRILRPGEAVEHEGGHFLVRQVEGRRRRAHTIRDAARTRRRVGELEAA